jgi:hypothetical protein
MPTRNVSPRAAMLPNNTHAATTRHASTTAEAKRPRRIRYPGSDRLVGVESKGTIIISAYFAVG